MDELDGVRSQLRDRLLGGQLQRALPDGGNLLEVGEDGADDLIDPLLGKFSMAFSTAVMAMAGTSLSTRNRLPWGTPFCGRRPGWPS